MRSFTSSAQTFIAEAPAQQAEGVALNDAPLGVKSVALQSPLPPSAASLFYLRHARSCAATASGARVTSSQSGCREPVASELLTEVIQPAAVRNLQFVKVCTGHVATASRARCATAPCLDEFQPQIPSIAAAIAWVVKTIEVTPAELASCACLANNLHAWAAGDNVAVLPLFLALVALFAAALELHLLNPWVCRCLSALVVSFLCPCRVFIALAFLDPTFGREEEQSLPPSVSAAEPGVDNSGPPASHGHSESSAPAGADNAAVEMRCPGGCSLAVTAVEHCGASVPETLESVIAAFEDPPATNEEVQRILDAARCLVATAARGHKNVIARMCTKKGGWPNVKTWCKSEGDKWKQLDLQQMKRNLEHAVLSAAREYLLGSNSDTSRTASLGSHMAQSGGDSAATDADNDVRTQQPTQELERPSKRRSLDAAGVRKAQKTAPGDPASDASEIRQTSAQ